MFAVMLSLTIIRVNRNIGILDTKSKEIKPLNREVCHLFVWNITFVIIKNDNNYGDSDADDNVGNERVDDDHGYLTWQWQ